MHNAAFAIRSGLNWCYIACEVDPQNLRAAIAGAKAMGFAGVNLTVPHKLLAVDMVDALDASAKRWGAVNTVFTSRSAATPVGSNTDADAIITSLCARICRSRLRAAKVLLLGAGGAGRTAALKPGVGAAWRELFLVNRTQSKAVRVKSPPKSKKIIQL